MIALLAFPRSGSDWITACLNSVQGIDIATEPFYGLRGQPETDWLEARHSGFYNGDGGYRGDYMQPTPSERMEKRLPVAVEDWVRNGAHGHNGFKEVYMAHKIPLLTEGLRAAGTKPRLVYLWRHFEGLCCSYQKRGIYWWVIQTVEQQRAGSVGTPVAPIYHLFEPQDQMQKLFLIWLAACYRDWIDTEMCGGMVVCYDDLVGGGPESLHEWNRMLTHIGYRGDPIQGVQSDPDTLARVAEQTEAFRREHAPCLDWMHLEAARMMDRMERPDILGALLKADVAARAERVVSGAAAFPAIDADAEA